jgi:hypothetical protein
MIMLKKNLNLWKSFWFLGSFVTASAIGSSAYAADPEHLYQAPGQPVIAIFNDSPYRESYALGCSAVRNLWSGVPLSIVSASTFKGIINQYPVVANINCGGQYAPEKFLPPSGPGALVLTHRNGARVRHYVNSTAWFTATQARRLQGSVPSYRGPDFRTIYKSPPGCVPGKPCVQKVPKHP